MQLGGYLQQLVNTGAKRITVLFAVFIAWIIWQANMGFDNWVLDVVRSTPNMDKVLHFTLFGGFAFFLSLAMNKRALKFSGFQLFNGVLFVAAFCVVEEITQLWISSRSFDLLDLACDFGGILLANLALSRLKLASLLK